ncbi:MAG TPA: sugar ABC transporter ATP-binding protein [Bacillota bacterium]|jgi:simple sugar transport system ATP-binding protein|nr:sugar ABC transporter ATP-binding protein [Peptococcaceae bacterium MAG4]NLW37747.1 sugar ABC transporter ATP-binding protein [Peptococcaceae bacterium]HPZ44039.1 sugar ABC transporter ATP-binding protein [Bacillota bacterium]HUM59270.1 sugar ABC transporter ATP-binding protein [Bacillota bacterium]
MEKILEIKNLSKSYNGIPALKNVSISVRAGEIHGIVGANGSGKSTLMNIISGNPVIRETGGYQGEIIYRGSRLQVKNCAEIIRLGVGMVHQEFALIPDLTIGENIKLGREETCRFTDRLFGRKYSFIDRRRNNEIASQVLKRLGLDVDVGVKIIDLSTNTKQFVEIAREVARSDLKLLLLDEPTAVLSKSDALKLLEVLVGMSRGGLGILFISHRLEEVQYICDRVTVFRDGEVVSRYKKGEINVTKLAGDMVGHQVYKANAQKRSVKATPVLCFKKFSVKMPGEEIKSLDLTVYEGEILGLTGLSGHGKLALGYGLMGMYPVAGEVIFKGHKLDRMNARTNIMKGIYVLPDDRQALGILPEHSLAENIIFTGDQVKYLFSRNPLGFIDWKGAYGYVEQAVRDFEIKCSSPKQRVKELSGGNLQKVCIARALTVNPQLLFVAEPTRGIDIAAKEKILKMLIDINRSKGTTIVIATSELDELKRVCDRIAVLVKGRVFKILYPDSPDLEFGLALAGEEGANYEGIRQDEELPEGLPEDLCG